jgi:hypothetical protein
LPARQDGCSNEWIDFTRIDTHSPEKRGQLHRPPWQRADQRLLTVPPAGNVHCILMREAK